jgi:hypothetical protein
MDVIRRLIPSTTTLSINAPFVTISQEFKLIDYRPRAVPMLPVTNWDSFQYTTVLIVDTKHNKMMLTNMSSILAFMLQSSNLRNYLNFTTDKYVLDEVRKNRGKEVMRMAVENTITPGALNKPDGSAVQVMDINRFQQMYNYWAQFCPEISFPCRPNESITLWHYSRSPPSIPNKSLVSIRLNGSYNGWTKALTGRTWAFDMTDDDQDRIPGIVYNALRTTSHILLITDSEAGYRPEGAHEYVKIGQNKLRVTRKEDGTWIMVKEKGRWQWKEYIRFSLSEDPIEMIIGA